MIPEVKTGGHLERDDHNEWGEFRARRRPGRPKVMEYPEDGRELVLRSAMDIFAEKGFSGATIREVASACGVDPALVGHHFGSKLGLWQAVVDRQAQHVLSEITKASEDLDNLSAAERFRHMIRALIKVAASNKSVNFFLLRELVDQFDRERYAYINKNMMNPIKNMIFPHIQDAIYKEEIEKFDPQYLFVSITSSVVSTYVSLFHIEKNTSEFEKEKIFIEKINETIDLMIFKKSCKI